LEVVVAVVVVVEARSYFAIRNVSKTSILGQITKQLPLLLRQKKFIMQSQTFQVDQNTSKYI